MSDQDKAQEGLGGAACSDPASWPTEFRGCQWDDGWEFEAPAVVYYPQEYARSGSGGNTGAIDQLVEDICFDIAEGNAHHDGGLDGECEWRGWGRRNFHRRRRARHVVIRVRWEKDDDEWIAAQVSRTETVGPPLDQNAQGQQPATDDDHGN